MMPAVSAPVATQAFAALSCVLMGLVAFMIRASARKRHMLRMHQLMKSAEMIRQHASSLDAFLGDPKAPPILKTVAMQFAVFMADKAAVIEFAGWSQSRPFGDSATDPDTLEILQAADRLRSENLALADAFSASIVFGAFGAILRWPESAKLFDLVAPDMVADRSREVAAAVRASRIKQRPFPEVAIRHLVPAH